MVAVMEQQTTLSVADICDKVGRNKIAQAVNRGVTAVSNAVAEGRFPASWYRAVKDLCEQQGLHCPDDLFKFIDAQPAKRATA